MLIIENEQAENIKRNIWFILSHFKHQNELFPRTIMTPKTGGQIVIPYRSEINDCIDQIYCYYKKADLIDCRINAFPFITQYSMDLQIKNKTPADFFMIDLDLKDFHSREKLNRTLRRTVRNLSQTFNYNSNPTVLWTGNGYHIYQPLSGFVLEKESVFFDFVKYLQKDLTSEFLRFVGPYFTKYNNDKQHMPSVRSCLVRIPGTINSKNMEEIRAIQEWSGTMPAINYILRDFRRYLIQKRITQNKITARSKQRQRLSASNTSSSRPSCIYWIENLLSIPISDYRKHSINLILSPYLITIKKLSPDQSFDILKKWLSRCDIVRKLDFDPHLIIKTSLNISISKRIPPMKLETLRDRNNAVYCLIKESIKNTNS